MMDGSEHARQKARLAAALRENLKRRKAQTRGRVADERPNSVESAMDLPKAVPEGKN